MRKLETFRWTEHNELLLDYITRVTKLDPIGYERLLNCVPSNMMHRFQHLKKLHVKECTSEIEIFESKEVDVNNEDYGIMHCELQTMYLHCLPKLTSIWKCLHG